MLVNTLKALKKKGSFCCLFFILLGSQASAQISSGNDYFAKQKLAYRIQTNNKSKVLNSTINSLNRPHAQQDCSTSIFRLVFGSPDNSETADDIQILNSGDFIIAGASKANNSNTNGLVAKFSNAGDLIWSKVFSKPSCNIVINKIRQTLDGGFIGIGTSEDIVSFQKDIVIVKFKADGTVDWSKDFSIKNFSSRTEAADIIELSEKGYAILCDNERSLIYCRLSESGSIIWQQNLVTTGTQKALSLFEGYKVLYLGSTGQDSAYSVVNVFKADISSGSILWYDKLGGPAQKKHYLARSMEYVNDRPKIVGVSREHLSSAWNIFRVSVYNTSETELLENYSFDTSIDSTANVVLTPWAEVIGFTGTKNSSAVNIFRHVPDAVVRWHYQLGDEISKNITGIERATDGGFLTIGTQTEKNGPFTDIFIYKTDSAGLQPSCGNGALSVTVDKSKVNQPYVSNLPILSQDQLTETASLINSLEKRVDTVYACKDFYCPIVPPTDSCAETFLKSYRSSSFCDLSYQIVPTKNGSVVVAGIMRDNPTGPETQRGLLVKFDKNGQILKRLKNGYQSSVIMDVYRSKDSMLIVPAYENGLFSISKLDDNLNTLWSKSYAMDLISSYYGGIAQNENGDIFLTLEYNTPWPKNILLLKFNKNGDLQWQKSYAANETFAGFYNTSITELNNHIFLKTETYVDGYLPGAMLFKIDETNGSIIWTKFYNNQVYEIAQHSKLITYNNMLLLYGGVHTSPYSTDRPLMIQIDEDGKFKNGKIYNSNLSSYFFFNTVVSKQNELITTFPANDYTSNPYQLNNCVGKIDQDLKVKFSRAYPLTEFYSYAYLTENTDESIFTSGYINYTEPYNNDFFVQKLTSSGKSGSCAFQDLLLKDSSLTFNVLDQVFNYAPDISIQSSPEPLQLINYDLAVNRNLCNSLNPCDSLSISGDSIVCNITDSLKFSVKKSLNCTLPYYITFDSALVSAKITDDSTITALFKKNGVVSIHAFLNAGCRLIQDSIQVKVQAPENMALNLGPDLQLCGDINRKISAGNQFKDYNWQDNSKDSFFTIKNPGLYFVTVKDLCNNTYTDSITVTKLQPEPIFIGADTFKCNNDTIQLTAPEGFTTYTWYPPVKITSTSSRQTKVFPSFPADYVLTAEKTQGCLSKDTIHIDVFTTPPINLGNDTSLCFGNSLLLDAGTNFLKYKWNTGQTTEAITAKMAGRYKVTAFDAHGCFSQDSITIIKVFDIPVISLKKDSTICEGDIKKIDARNGFAKYQWSTGASSSSIDVNTTGTYWVKVTDQNGCSAADSAAIKFVLPLPKSFITRDTTKCSYETITLMPYYTYAEYHWSTGSFTNSIEVKDQGNYWLEVKDKFGCKAKETIVVNNVECLNSIYFPSAFSPNKDGLNDVYKPGLFGTAKKYSLSIYNRFGQKVFESSDPTKGWDGKVNGINQNPGAYVWVCTYEFLARPGKTEKGTFVLVR